MRSLRIKDGARDARQVLSGAWQLIKSAPVPTLLLGGLLALLPALLRAFFASGSFQAVLASWELWIDGALSASSTTTDAFMGLVGQTMQQSGVLSLASSLLDLSTSLIFTPLLLSSLALLYNGFIEKDSRAALHAVTAAGKNVRNLILVAVACMVAEWIVQMIPSIASGLLSLVANLLSWIPLLGTIAYVLAIVLSLLLSGLTDFAVVVIFCYVWICATCEGISGFGALVRSWQLTRNAMRETIYALLALTLLRWLVVLILALLWLFAGRPAGVPLAVLVYLAYGVGALFTVVLGPTTSALYQRRPVPGGPQPGQFRADGPDLRNMKRANLD